MWSDNDARSTRQYIANLLENPESSTLAQVCHYWIIALILASTMLTCVETMPEVRSYTSFFVAMDYCVTGIFTLEFLLRLYAAESTLAFCTNVFNFVDLISLAPGYSEIWLQLAAGDIQQMHQAVGSMRTLRMIRVLRMGRVVRIMSKSSPAEQMLLLLTVMCRIARTGVLVILAVLSLTIIFVATVLYSLEAPLCLEAPHLGSAAQATLASSELSDCGALAQFDSIPSVFWWAAVTLTTVGYGDLVPTTAIGKVVGGCTCFWAVMILAVAAAQFSVSFRQQWSHERAKAQFMKRFAADPGMVKEHEDVQALLRDFQDCLDGLTLKVSCLSVSVGGGSTPSFLAPALMSIKEQAAALNAGTCSFIYEALSEAMLQPASSFPQARAQNLPVDAGPQTEQVNEQAPILVPEPSKVIKLQSPPETRQARREERRLATF